MARGLIFRAFRLSSVRCHTCAMDVIYRRDYPFECRWCGGFTFDIALLQRYMSAVIDEFNRTMQSVITAVARTADDLETLRLRTQIRAIARNN